MEIYFQMSTNNTFFIRLFKKICVHCPHLQAQMPNVTEENLFFNNTSYIILLILMWFPIFKNFNEIKIKMIKLFF